MSRRLVVLAVVGVLAVGALFTWRTAGSDLVTVRAAFTQAVGLYPGDDVRVLGVPMGKVTSVEPRGDVVEVVMQLDPGTPVAADTKAVIVPPGVLSSRYVQLTEPWTGGAKLTDGAELDVTRTAAPLELDDVTRQLNRFLTALGPHGANKDGALASLVDSAAKALDGNGTTLRHTLSDVAHALDTLGSSSDDIVTTLQQLQLFVTAIDESDGSVRRLERSLAAVSTQLADQRGQLRTTITNLARATRDVDTFVRTNRGGLTTSVRQLKTLSTTLADRQRELMEVLDLSAIGTEGIFGAANLTTGTLDARVDLTPLFRDSPTALCQIFEASGFAQLCAKTVPKPSGEPR